MTAETMIGHRPVESPIDWVMDLDSHEMVPTHLWGDAFGDASGRIGEILAPGLALASKNDIHNPGVAGDLLEITAESVWNAKGVSAPGAIDMSRRVECMDTMRVERQLIFPSYALIAGQLMQDYSAFLNNLEKHTPGGLGIAEGALKELGAAGVDEYNDWAVQVTAENPQRMRPVAYLPAGDGVGELLERTQDLIDRGIRAVHVLAGVPLASESPASPLLDPFWDCLAKHDVACTMHIGGDGDFMKAWQWSQAPAFKPGPVESSEIGLDPYSFGTLHLPYTNFLVCMILGGVFERHPTLRVGVIECAAHWFGPLIESLDMWQKTLYRDRLAPFISSTPTEYAARNIRVTPFCAFEPVAQFFERYPQLHSCYAYSSDYPHVEGGKESKKTFLEALQPLGSDVCNKFFVDNGRWLLPD